MSLDELLKYLQNLINDTVTQKDIADALNITKQAVNRKRGNNYQFKDFEIKKIVNYLLVKNGKPESTTIEDCTELPVLGNVTASMGYGLTVYNETKTGTYSISNKLAKDLGVNLSASDIIFAKGDSMEPTIMGGDSLLVDKSKCEVYDGRIYCIRYEGELYAKRLQKIPPKKIKVVSDNQDKYDAWYVDYTKEIDFDFEIIGEILWWGRVAR